MQNKIFLGGTCGNSTWREEIIPFLNIDYFNPVVKNWTQECRDIEEKEKSIHCNIHLYVITKEIQGVFSIAEAIDSCFQAGKVVIVQIRPEGFNNHQLKSLEATVDKVKERGGIAFVDDSLERLTTLINSAFVD